MAQHFNLIAQGILSENQRRCPMGITHDDRLITSRGFLLLSVSAG
ncbi:hypothetical protein [Paraburkholderia kirstenboschensis]|uniref:Uncharacterized protein n=1 Tax=Paraburkholderia kirstenboschensis TaxID=1245436 RepID=A0ABZ0EB59_9BURK|nr:hypothetical protein [Paraburkholderia kirstenboschensis]WOD13432.1 hypothetical protein RW095_05195 [Paraburkholderia kirstenboschensis]